MEEGLEKGIEVEFEHKRTYEWFKAEMLMHRIPSLKAFAKHIAMDHLNEHEEYYNYLEVIEDIMSTK